MRRRLTLLVVPLLLLPVACGGSGTDESAADGASTAEPSTEEPSTEEPSTEEPSAGETAEQEPAAGAPEPAPAGELPGVSVTGAPDSEPEITVDAPFTIDETTAQVVEQGDGEAVGDGDTVTTQYVIVDGKSGETLESSWQTGQPVPLEMAADRLLPGLYSGIIGQSVGSRVAIGVTADDAFGAQGNPELGIDPDTSIVFIADLLERQPAPPPPPEPVADPLEMAEGAERAAPDTLPTVEVNGEGVPQGFTANGDEPKRVEELVAAPVIVGDGPAVAAGETLTVQYLGQLYPDGEVFDQSWERGEPFTFQLGTGGVIPGWDEGLAGQTVGSRVVLAIPSDLAYGPQGSPPTIPADSDLMFVVDILGANGD